MSELTQEDRTALLNWGNEAITLMTQNGVSREDAVMRVDQLMAENLINRGFEAMTYTDMARTFDNWSASALQGLSLGAGDEATAALNALGAFFDDRDFADVYDQGLNQIRTGLDAFRNTNPTASLGMEIGGGLLTGGAGALRTAGLAGGSRLARLGVAAGTGAAEGAAAGFASGEGGVDNRLENMGFGAAAGGITGGVAAPVIGAIRGLGRLTGLNRLVPGFTNRASTDQIARTLESSGYDLDTAGRELLANQARGIPETLADANYATTRLLRGTTRSDPAVDSTVRNFLTERNNESRDRILTGLFAESGATGGYRQRLAQLVDTRNSEANTHFDIFRQTLDSNGNTTGMPRPITVTQSMDDLLSEPIIQQQWNRLRGIVNGMPSIDDVREAGVVNAEHLEYLRRTLGDVVYNASSGMTARDSVTRSVAGGQGGLIDRLIGSVEPADQSLWQRAISAYEDNSRLINAGEAGRSILTIREDRLPDFLDTTGSLTPAEREYAMTAAIDAVSGAMQDFPSTVNVVARIWGNETRREAFRSLFPDDASWRRFEDMINREIVFRQTGNAIMGNSSTASQLYDAYQAHANPLELIGMAALSPAQTMAVIGRRAGPDTESMSRRVGGVTARGLTTTNPDELAALLDRIANNRGMNPPGPTVGPSAALGTIPGLLSDQNEDHRNPELRQEWRH